MINHWDFSGLDVAVLARGVGKNRLKISLPVFHSKSLQNQGFWRNPVLKMRLIIDPSHAKYPPIALGEQELSARFRCKIRLDFLRTT